MSKTTLNKKSATWQYKGKKDLVIPVNLSPYEALRMVGVPFNPHTLSGFIRPQNASYGVKNSFHKRPWKGSKRYGSAVDLTPAPGYTYDDILRALAHPALQAWAKANGYGILDERPASVRKRTNATGPHLHFGPDKGATKIYANPLIAPHYSYWKSLGMKTPEYHGAEVKYDNIRGNININTPVTVSNNPTQYIPLELILTPLLQPVYIPALQQVNGFDLTYNNYDWSNLFDSAPQKSNLLEHVLPLYNYEYSNNINLLAPFLFSDILGNSSISEPEEKKLKIRFAADGGLINTFKDGGKPVSFSSVADMIKAHEGFKATPYKDGRNKKTGELWYSVGYGFNDSGIHHNIGKKYIGRQMTREEADNLLLGYITHLQGTLKKTLGDKIYNSLTPGQMMAYIDTGYQRPATMINAAKLHRKTGNINNVANALAVKGYDKRNANRRNAFLGNISINQQNIPEYQEVIQPVQIPQMQQAIYQQPSVLTSVNIPESSIVEDYNYLNDDEYTEDVQKPNMAIVSANPELYGELFNNTEFLKAMFEPLGVNNNLIKNVENKKLQFKHISAEGGALVIDNGNGLVDNQDWDSYIKQKFSEYENYQIVPDLTEEEILRESNGIPLYANGGEMNIFGPGGFTYIPDNQQNMVVNPFEFEGIKYGWLPNGDIGEDVYREHNDRNGVYVRWDNDNNKWAKTTVSRDLGNIKNYFANRHNELATYDDTAPAASAYDANGELVKPNIERYTYWDPINVRARDIALSRDIQNRMFLNNLLEGAMLFGGPGLIALGLSNPTTFLPTIGGLAGYSTGAPILNQAWANYVSPEHNTFDYDFGNAAVSPIRTLLGDNNKASITDKNATIIGSFFNPAGLFTAKLGTKTGNSINSVVNSYPLISQLVKNNNFYTPLRTAMAMPKFLDTKFMLEMSRTPQIINDSELYQWSNYSKKQWRDFLKNWNNEAAKGNYYIKNNWLNIDAKPSDIEKIFETGRKTYKAVEEAKKLALQYADKYHSQMNALKDPILRSIAEKSPQYLDEVYEQQLKGGATPEFVKDLIKKANSYRRSMNGENLTSDDFLTFRGHSNVGNREFRSIDVEGETPSSNYGHVRGYFEGLPELKGDFSTWWDLRIPQGVEVRPGMHDVEAAILDLNKISEGADNIAVSNAFYDTYLPTGAAYRYVVHPVHLVFRGSAETMLPNFKVTLNEAPANFSWSKGYSSGGNINKIQEHER